MDEEIVEFAEKMQEATQNADDYNGLLSSLLSISQEYDIENELTEEVDEDDQPHLAFTLLNACINFLDKTDDISGAKNHDAISEFVDKLVKQNKLGQVSSIIFLDFSKDQEFLYKYGNTFNREIGEIIGDLAEISETKESDPERLLDAYRPWGSLCETALPPVLTVLNYLENDEVDFDISEKMNFRDAIDMVEGFPSLDPIAKQLHVDLRNSISHGGVSGDYRVNPMTEEITFWFERDGEDQKLTMGFGEFREYVLKTLSAVVSLFLLPLYIFSTHVCIEIDSVDS